MLTLTLSLHINKPTQTYYDMAPAAGRRKAHIIMQAQVIQHLFNVAGTTRRLAAATVLGDGGLLYKLYTLPGELKLAHTALFSAIHKADWG